MATLVDHGQALNSVLDDVRTLTVQQLVELYRQYGDHPDFSTVLAGALPQIVNPHAQAAGLVAAHVFDDIHGDSGFQASPIIDLPEARLQGSTEWALRAPTKDASLSRMAGSAKRMVTDAARTTVVGNAAQVGVKWVRYAQPDACAFCRLLATRTSARTAYNSAASALTVVGRGTAGGGRTRGSRPLGEKYHDHCRCLAIPVPDGEVYVPPAYTAEWQQQYEDARTALRKGKKPTTPKNILAQMRKADGGDAPGRKDVQAPGDDALSPSAATPLPTHAPTPAITSGTGAEPPKPPVPPVPTGGAAEDDDPAARLNSQFARQTESMSEPQKASVRRWQGKDRFYQDVQRAAAGDPTVSAEALQVSDDLQNAARPLTEDVSLWRGIRSIVNAFDVDPAAVSSLAGTTHSVDRFFSTTVQAAVARDEFTKPATSPALFKIVAKAGAQAVWLPPAGDPGAADQGELLFTPGLLMRILSVDESGDVPVIEMEVSNGRVER